MRRAVLLLPRLTAPADTTAPRAVPGLLVAPGPSHRGLARYFSDGKGGSGAGDEGVGRFWK